MILKRFPGICLAVLIELFFISNCGNGMNDLLITNQSSNSGSSTGSSGSGATPSPSSSTTATPTPTSTPPVLIKTLDASWISLTQLKLYMKFDEPGSFHGSTINDSSGSALTAVLQTSNGATVKTGTGIVANALNFDGTDDYVAVTDPGATSVLDFTTADSITISAWIKPALLPAAGQQILTKGVTAAVDNSNYGIGTGDGLGTNGARFSFSFFDGAAWQVYSSSGNYLVTTVWQHVGVTFTFGTPASAVLYYNGAPVSGSWVGGTGSSVPMQTNEPIWVGGCNASAAPAVDTPFSGMIDEVSVWKRALTAPEIAAIYGRPAL